MPRRRLLLATLLLSACSTEEGERRPLEVLHQGPSPAPIRVKGEEVFFDGRWVKDGRVTFFDTLGNVTHEGDYKLGFESGPWTERGEDGITGKGLYLDGKRDGSWEYRYASGDLQSKGNYRQGERTGKWMRYYPGGGVEAELPYKDGKLEGIVIVYDDSGAEDMEASGTFRGGERVR